MRKTLSLGLVLCLGLVMAYGVIGSGASFTAQATAVQNIGVGTFGCNITSTQQGVTVVNTDGANGTHSVTLNSATIMGSAAGNSPFVFRITSTGNIPVKVHITQTVPVAPFTSMLADPVADQLLNAQNAYYEYNAGLQWPELTNNDLGKQATITYTATCLEQSATYLPPVGTFTRAGNVLTIRVNNVDGTPILPGDTLSTYNMGAPFGTPGWSDNLATADASGVIYYTGNGFTPPAIQAGVGQYQITVKRGGSIMKSFAAHL